jgi:8-oxo-dGTP diphosphatase
MKQLLVCPKCKGYIETYKNPTPTVDIIIESRGLEDGIILIERRNEPFGWALPGGFVDYGESLEDAAVREAKEETGLDIYDLVQLKAYSKPNRDPRQHNISFVFVAKGKGELKAGDDAGKVQVFHKSKLDGMKLAFDHSQILKDYLGITQFEFWKLVR